MSEEWTVSIAQLRSLYVLVARGDKGTPTGARNTNSAVTYATAEALEARGLARIAVEVGDYRIYPTERGEQYAAQMKAQGRL